MADVRPRRLAGVVLRAPAAVLPYLAYAQSFLRRDNQIVRVWPEGRIELGPNVALFTHFDRGGQLADHVAAYVQALHRGGFSVVFVSNAGRRLQNDLAGLKPYCQAIIVRNNVGYDFGAIRQMLAMLDLPRQETERLLVVNDSVYGPLVPISNILARANLDTADIWGLTESWQHRYHLQSYFLLVGRPVMLSKAWQDFWDGVRQVSSKRWVIHRYEIGLTQALLKAGYRCRALWPYHELLDQVVESPGMDQSSDPLTQMRAIANRRLLVAIARRIPLNPTSDLWRQLLLTGYPFLKVELLRKNPTKVPDVADWRSVLATLPGVDTAMIEKDLRQKTYNQSP